MLEAGDVLPKTSQAPPDTFARIFRELRDKGDEAIVITVSSRLSGTFQSALIAAEDFPNVRVVDSRNVSIGSRVLAEYAQQCVEQGMGLDELTQHLIRNRDNVCLLARLDTLEYLKKGGRISKTTAFAGGVLNIKPVVTVKDGDVVFLGKARGSRKANNFLVEQISLSGIDYTKPVLLGYTGTSDEMLKEYISESRDLWEGKVDRLCCEQLCSVIGTHAGPGGVAVAFFKSTDVSQ
jgi:DegV family protein with EDD domain